MAAVDIKDLEYYIGCNQGEAYYFNFVSEEIERIDDIITELSVSKEDFIYDYYYYNYIPLPALNVTTAYDGFIDSLNNKKISALFRDVDKEDSLKYWLKFDEVFHVGMERRFWEEYYDRYVHKKAVEWCNEYGIYLK